MKFQQTCINNRSLTNYRTQLSLLEKNKNYLFDLSYLGIIELTGEKSAEFLQGQITCDVNQVHENHMQQGALCNIKGRILALLDVVQWNGIKLILPNDLLEQTESSLAKTAMFSRVTLCRTQGLKILGFLAQNPKDKSPISETLPTDKYQVLNKHDYLCYCIDKNLYIFLVKDSHYSNFISGFKDSEQWLGALSWHQLQLEHGIVEIYPETRGSFLPHRLGLQNKGYLNFNKGCYKGQEIIARTHYRAKLKHSLKLYQIQTNTPPISGNKLYSEDGQKEIGEVIDYSPLTNNTYLIAASVLNEHPQSCILEGTNEMIPLNTWHAAN